jgi:uncharacterized protein YijF (DUF1287 family)
MQTASDATVSRVHLLVVDEKSGRVVANARAFLAKDMDLQKLVHEDMRRNFSQYPKKWGLGEPDTNIDHRRVPNLQVYFTRKGYSLAVTDNAKDYRPGDFVMCIVPPNLPHIMIVSDATNSKGRPLIIHNIGPERKRRIDCLSLSSQATTD